MILPVMNIFMLASGLMALEIAGGMAVPEYRLRTFMESAALEDEPRNPNTTVSVDFRRDTLTPTGPSFTNPTDKSTPLNNQEVKCGAHIYSNDYIKRTLDTIISLGSANKTLGKSGFPQQFGNEGRILIFPLMRCNEIFDGSDEKTVGPDRIAVSMTEKRRYMIFTIGQKKSLGSLNIHACEYLVPKNASITVR